MYIYICPLKNMAPWRHIIWRAPNNMAPGIIFLGARRIIWRLGATLFGSRRIIWRLGVILFGAHEEGSGTLSRPILPWWHGDAKKTTEPNDWPPIDIWCMLYDIWYMLYYIWHTIYDDIWYMMYDLYWIWYMVYDEWVMIYA